MTPKADAATGASAERRAALEGARLRSLIKRRGLELRDDIVASGAVVAARTSDGTYVVPVGGGTDGFGGALVWWRRHGDGPLHIVAESETAGDMARWANELDPPPTVWEIDHDDLRPASAEPLAEPLSPPTDVDSLIAAIEAAGADLVVESGVIRGEVLGIEVARIVTDGDEPRLDVGVGRFDQEATALLSPEVGVFDALDRVVDYVQENRRPAAPAHPLHRVARQRWLRAALIADPSSIGLSVLEAVEPATRRSGIRHEVPAPAVGASDADHNVLVVAATGVDLSVTAAVVDGIVRHRPDRTVVVLPDSDVRPIVREVLELVPGVEVVGVSRVPWLD